MKHSVDLLRTFFPVGILLGVLWMSFYVFPSKVVGEAKTMGLYQKGKCRALGLWESVQDL